MMSKQLALSIAFSVMAMCGYVLLGTDAATPLGAPAANQPDIYAVGGAMPALSQFLPVLQ